MSELEKTVAFAKTFMRHKPDCRLLDKKETFLDTDCTCSLDYAINQLDESIKKIIEATR